MQGRADQGRDATMTPIVREVQAKSILSRSKVYPWTLNP